VASFEEQAAGATPARDEVKALTAHSGDELRALIALVKGEPKDAGSRDQFEKGIALTSAHDHPADQIPAESSPHSYAAVLADLHITVNALLGTSERGHSP